MNDYSGRFDERQWRVTETIREAAANVDATPTQGALRWLIDRERFTCVPVVGVRSVDSLSEYVGSIDFYLTADQLEVITDAYASLSW